MKKLWKGLCTIFVFMTVWFCCATSGNMKVGNTFTLKATVKPDNAIVKSVTWTNSNSKIASVSASGKGMAEYSVQS